MGIVRRARWLREVAGCPSRLPLGMAALLILLVLHVSWACAADKIVEVTVDGIIRTAIVVAPQAALNAQSAPLVLAFHGSTWNGKTMQSVTEFDDLARKHGFVVAYPNGTGPSDILSWNAGSCCSTALERGVDDIAFVDALVDELLRRFPIDPHRVYATGFSNGGMLTYRLARERPHRFAAIAVVSGALFASHAPDGVPMPAWIAHGTDDPIIPYAGGWGALRTLSGKTEPALPAPQVAAYWADANNCHGEPHVTRARNALIRTDRDCEGNAQVVFVTLLGGDHRWPQIASDPSAFLLSDEVAELLEALPDGEIPWDVFETGVDATRRIWEFFAAHRR